ncbi:PAS domain S-box protein [Noviherbaspirillum sp. CPCC 100848]|uniref:histidine kinase n=1 Tax=Noviherbaspirillum album TaxID=3080276 RepID=A0ABU6JBL1_9BURK|nr:PAS domain S-box protein [Noviherbaspirillum sp. CPCC 100848]MEC4721043.1 PAS domain S-box protein [Noviherbaspirillum sp. CPCC 100848]
MDFNELVLREIPDAVVVLTPEGRIAHWTRGAEQVFGYDGMEAGGKPLLELLVPQELHAEEIRYLTLLKQTGSCSYESVRQTKSGALIHVDVSSRSIHAEDGALAYVLSSQKDVTGLKVRRDAKLLEAKFRDLLECMPDGIVMSNATGHIVLANSQAERLFGYAHHELLGLPVDCLLRGRQAQQQLAHPLYSRFRPSASAITGATGSTAGAATASTATNTGTTASATAGTAGLALHALHSLHALRKDGREIPVEVSTGPVQTEEGPLVMCAIRDMTERRQIERTLHEKNMELKKANLAKDHFLAAMSHELRTPLNAIIGFTGTLLMRLPGPLTQDQDKQLRTVQHSAKHLLSLINDLLDLARVESGKISLHVEAVSLSSLVSGIIDTITPLARQKDLALKFDAPDRDVVFQTDRRAVSQILLNLVNNAVKFTERGSILVSLRERVRDGTREAIISVCDSGIGIREEDQGRLFEAFSQVDTGSTRRYEGSGLGLYLSRQLAALLGAQLAFVSNYGEGSQFTLSLRERGQ